VETLTGSRLRGFPVSSSASRVHIIAAQTLKAARNTLAKASEDAGVRYTFYLLTQLAAVSAVFGIAPSLSSLSSGVRLSSSDMPSASTS
jgi:hypothetical protein